MLHKMYSSRSLMVFVYNTNKQISKELKIIYFYGSARSRPLAGRALFGAFFSF